MAVKTAEGKYIVFEESWTEYIRGMECPGGYTLHISKEHRDRYVKAFIARLPKEVPDEFSAPDDNLKPTLIDDALYVKLVASGDGLWGPVEF